MIRRTLLGICALALCDSTTEGDVLILLADAIDDIKLVRDASEQAAVKEFRKKLDAFTEVLQQKGQIEGLLGKPAAKLANTFAMPVAQRRGFAVSGERHS